MNSLSWRAPVTRSLLKARSRFQCLRKYATEPTAATTNSKVSRIESRTPRFLRRYLAPLRDAPISHITAFILLHELTAVVPLFGLAAGFHYFNWLPPYISEGKWVTEGTQKFGKWMRKRGWIVEDNRGGRWWGRGESGVRIVVELATAYAITKALLPLRLILSVSATPWFARWTVLPLTARVKGMFRKKKVMSVQGKDAAGTGAVGAATLPKQVK